MGANRKLSDEEKAEIGKVALIYGGTSAERQISLKSGAAVEAALQRLGIDHVAIDLQDNLVASLEGQNIDRVFLILHGVGGEDGTIQGALEVLGLPYTGSGVLASALAMDKAKTKQLWQGIGLPTAKFVSLDETTDWASTLVDLGGKVIVKPATEGSSIGMSVAENPEQLQQSYLAASQFDASVIAEQWITGNEYTVAILGDKALPVIKLETDNSFYDFQAKYESNDTRYILPCGLDSAVEEKLQSIAVEAFNSLGCSGWGRVDLMEDQAGNFYLLEVNTLPGMTDHSLVPMAANHVGIAFEDLVFTILKLSV